MMANEKHIDLITGYLQGTLSDAQRQKFDRLVRSGEIDSTEVKAMEMQFKQLGDLPSPKPDPEMHERFQSMLQREKEALPGQIAKQQQEKDAQPVQPAGHKREKNLSQPAPPGLQQKGEKQGLKQQQRETKGHTSRIRHLQTAAAIAAVFLAGLLLGSLYPGRGTHEQQIQQIASEVHDLREMMMISLLDETSAAERLRAVNISMDIPSPQDRVIHALIETLHFDPSVNVRVAAVDALVHHGSHPTVREELVRAISRQPSPIVQVALADAMIALQEPRAAREFQKLLEQDEMEEPVRDKIEHTLLALL